MGFGILLKFRNVTKIFGFATAVDNISFDVEKSQFIGIVGRSGAGKSTALRMLNRLTDATSGSIMFEGQDVTRFGGSAKLKWQSECAMIFQQFNLVPRMDVVSNVLHGTLNRRSTLATMFNMFPKDDIFKAVDLLEQLGIGEHAMKRAEALSGGQQQRVAIARAMMQDPKIILADEPIASLDPMNAQIVMDNLRKIHDQDGRLVICNLHTLDTARRYCDRVIGMRDGMIVFDGKGEELTVDIARDIYGADESFSEASTSTSVYKISTDGTAARPALITRRNIAPIPAPASRIETSDLLDASSAFTKPSQTRWFSERSSSGPFEARYDA